MMAQSNTADDPCFTICNELKYTLNWKLPLFLELNGSIKQKVFNIQGEKFSLDCEYLPSAEDHRQYYQQQQQHNSIEINLEQDDGGCAASIN